MEHDALIRASGISPEVAQARGYVSADTRAQLVRFGFSPAQQRVPGLLIPVWNVAGKRAFYQYRPDSPRVNADGKPIRYESPPRVRMVLDCHPFARQWIGDPGRPLFVTEGIRKADSAISRGLCCVALLGVWNWRGRNSAGGKVALPDWESVALEGRQVYLVFDSDVMLKAEVHAALARLKAFLSARGAQVAVIHLPAGDGGAKVGLDDYLAAGHSVNDLLALATAELRSTPKEPPAPPPVPVLTPEQAAEAQQRVAPLLREALDAAAQFIRRYVVLQREQVDVAALEAAHTHFFAAADTTPYMWVSSPARESGKTRFLEVMALLVARPWHTGRGSPAVLVRKVEKVCPTLLLDETDAAFGSGDEYANALRGLLNAGHRRGGRVSLCVGQGAAITYADFEVFCPKVLAGLKRLPDTVESRSIPIRMRRRTPDEVQTS